MRLPRLFKKRNQEESKNIETDKNDWTNFDFTNKVWPKWFQYLSLSVLAVILTLIVTNMYTAFTTEIPHFQNRNQELLNPKADTDSLLIMLDKTKNYQFTIQKRLAMDSLIDNNIFTVENIAKIDSMYPDSLCDCL